MLRERGRRAPRAAAEVPLAVHRRVPGHRSDPGRDLPDARGGRSRCRAAGLCRRPDAVRPLRRFRCAPARCSSSATPSSRSSGSAAPTSTSTTASPQRIEATGGEVLSLTANFRSLPGVCALANTVFPPLFAGSPARTRRPSSRSTRCAPESDAPAGPRVATLTLPRGRQGRGACGSGSQRASRPTSRRRWRRAGARSATSWCSRGRSLGLRIYRRGVRRARDSRRGQRRRALLQVAGGAGAGAAARRRWPIRSTAVSLVGVLRGPLFGLSDPELFRFRQAGGRFELSVPLAGGRRTDATRPRSTRSSAPSWRRCVGSRAMLAQHPHAAAGGRRRAHPRGDRLAGAGGDDSGRRARRPPAAGRGPRARGRRGRRRPRRRGRGARRGRRVERGRGAAARARPARRRAPDEPAQGEGARGAGRVPGGRRRTPSSSRWPCGSSGRGHRARAPQHRAQGQTSRGGDHRSGSRSTGTAHEEEETKYRDAERLRLLYVAARGPRTC